MAVGSWSAEAGLSTWDWSTRGARRAHASAGVSELQPTAFWPHPASSLTALKLRMLFSLIFFQPRRICDRDFMQPAKIFTAWPTS